MTKKIKNTLTIALLYAGAIIGAGFASGHEIIYFFTRYGTVGVVGFILACLLFCLLGGVVLHNSYTGGLHGSAHRRDSSPWGTKGLFNIFLLFSYAIMVAGMATIMTEMLGIDYSISVVAVASMVSLSLAFDIRGIVAIGNYVVPFLIVGLTLLCGKIIALGPGTAAAQTTAPPLSDAGWVFHAVLYVGYNGIVAIMFLPSLSHLIHSEKDAIISGVLGGAFILIPGVVMVTALLYHGAHLINTELPLLSLAGKLGAGYTATYLALLAAAMYTTAIATLYSIITWLDEEFRISYRFQLIILPLLAIPLATTGFSKLVRTIYPFFGYLGTAYITYILVKHFRSPRRKYC